MNSQFLSTDYIYKYTVIEANVDADLVTKFINKAQLINIKATLGSYLYDILVSECPNFTGIHRTLVKDYIQPAQAEWCVYHALPFINFRLTNKAVSQKSSDNSQPSGSDDIRWLQSQVRNNAEYLSEEIKNFIKNNIESFPEYRNSDPENPFGVKANKSNYFCGIRTSGYKSRIAPLPNPNNIDPNDYCL